ncbi:MAG TPA: hypothetical protein VIF10_16575 [Methylobacter sp.]
MFIAMRAIGLGKYKSGGESSIATNMKSTAPACMAVCFKFILMATVIGIIRTIDSAVLF